MKRCCWILIMLISMQTVYGQENDLVQILEDQAGADDTHELEEDLQQWQNLRKHPLNLNTAGGEAFSIFAFITPIQVQRLILYRKALGPLKNILELQAVPGWTAVQIHKIAPYVTVSTPDDWRKEIKADINAGRSQLLTRIGMRKMPAGQFPGSAPSVLLRYQFRSKFLQFAVNSEKDMGEQFFQKGKGISFLSLHLALYGKKNPGNILILGDYLLNMGQGLIHWQGRTVRKTGMPIMIKHQLPLVQPYRSNDENRFHRGLALVLNKGRWTSGFFFSDKKIDANRKYDSLKNFYYVSSLLTSGYHRTKSELENKHSLRLTSAGAVIAYRNEGLRIGINAIHHFFSLPYIREYEPYRVFVFRGQHMANYSLDYHYTFRNIHFFGEAAVNQGFHQAYLQGIMVAPDPRLDLSILARTISHKYYSLQGNAFLESSEPANEEGIYAGASLRLTSKLTFDAYVDFYRFPWLKYGIDLPGQGKDFLLQGTLRVDKKTIFYIRYRHEIKTGNIGNAQNLPVSNFYLADLDPLNTSTGRMNPAGFISRSNYRVHLVRIFSQQVECRLRMETVKWINGQQKSNGYLFFSDIFWTPVHPGFSLQSRFLYYETTDYSSRLYAFENDVMYYNIIPSFSGHGMVMYLNARLALLKHAQFFLKGSMNKEKTVPGLSWLARFQVILSW